MASILRSARSTCGVIVVTGKPKTRPGQELIQPQTNGEILRSKKTNVIQRVMSWWFEIATSNLDWTPVDSMQQVVSGWKQNPPPHTQTSQDYVERSQFWQKRLAHAGAWEPLIMWLDSCMGHGLGPKNVRNNPGTLIGGRGKNKIKIDPNYLYQLMLLGSSMMNFNSLQSFSLFHWVHYVAITLPCRWASKCVYPAATDEDWQFGTSMG